MEFHQLHISMGERVADDDCRVHAQENMVEVFRRSTLTGSRYLFVEDESGRPMGVIATEDVMKQVTDPAPGELQGWMNRPVESVLQSRIDAPDVRASGHNAGDAPQPERFTQVAQNGKLIGLITSDDVLISWRSVQRTLQISQGDAVTGLPNRATFDQHLAAEFSRAARTGQSVAGLLVDLDYFKQINDQFGHHAGDIALRAISDALRQSLRSYDLVARYGGDELAIICSGCRPQEVDRIVRYVRETVLQLQTSPAAPRPLPTVSVGAAVVHDITLMHAPSQLMAAADECLYAAKKAGRNCAWKCELQHDAIVRPIHVSDRYAYTVTDNGLSAKARYDESHLP